MSQKTTTSPEFNNLVKQIKRLGFDGVLYSFYPIFMHNKKVQPILHACEKTTPFVNHYLENNYGRCDFAVRLALQGQETIDWWQEIDADNVSNAERLVTEDGKANFDICNGFTIVIPFYKFAVAVVSVISTNKDTGHFQKMKNMHLEVLQNHADKYHTSVIESSNVVRFFITPILKKLNDKSKKVLKHLISGKPMKSICNTHDDISQKYQDKPDLFLQNPLYYCRGPNN